jgi:glyoxylase-like metal-dependent hydrolase (beta-lactamase superfamily II)
VSGAIVPGRVVRLSPLVRRVTQDNPGLMTGPGTNTYLIGAATLFVLDPGEDRDEHFAALTAAIGSTPVAGIAPTHAHPDHWPMAPRLARRFGAPTYGARPHSGYVPDTTLADGARISAGSWTLRAVHTPGHVSDHVAYLLEEERALFTGDHVMAWSTSVIARPDGDLVRYLASLERVRSLDPFVLYPAHGEPVERPRERVDALIAHRRMRSAEILAALAAGDATVGRVVARVYAGVDPRLHPVARQSVLAHLEALIASGDVAVASPAPDPLERTYVLRKKTP